MAGQVFIGTSGYAYPHWRGIFYPQGLRTSEGLRHYSQHFTTVELNNPFYRLPEASTFEGWRKGTPSGFVFAVKASRFITHLKRLKDPEVSVGLFLERARSLGEKLGPVLFQLPPSWPFNALRLEGFLRYLRRQSVVRKLRRALEVRHESWLDPKVSKLLEEAGVALCLADWPDLPVEEPIAGDFVYIRRHGPTSLYSSSYSEEALAEEARKVRGWLKRGLDVYIYYNNDAYGYAIQNALRLKALMASPPSP